MSRNLITIGAVLVALGLGAIAVGLYVRAGGRLPPLGRLPGDIRIEGEHTRFYFPITTCLLISAILTLAWALIQKLR